VVYSKKEATKFIGYYAITVADMREGLRVVPLKGDYGIPLVSGDLLVEVNKHSFSFLTDE